MMARLLLLTLLPLLAAPACAEVVYLNERQFQIPAGIKPDRIALIQHVLLFVSRDKGQSWNQVGKISPHEAKMDSAKPGELQFPFEAPLDCECWFRVASVDRQNQQDPIDISKAKETLVIVVDTTKPIVKLQAQRQGSEVVVGWSMVEYNPNLVKVEYQAKDEGSAVWQSVPAQSVLDGQTRFTPSTQGTVVVRFTAIDKAGNTQYAMAEAAGFPGAAAVAYSAPPKDVATLPDAIAIPVNAGTPALPSNPTPALPPPTPALPPSMPAVAPPPLPSVPAAIPTPPTPAPLPPTPAEPILPIAQPVAQTPSVPSAPPRVLQAAPIPGYPSQQMPPSQPITRTFAAEPRQPAVSQQPWANAPLQPDPTLRTIASSEYTPQPIVPVQQTAPPPVPAAPARKLPTLTFVNTPEVILEYEVSQIGPSGIGSVDIYCSIDDGQNWVSFVDDPHVIGKTQAGVHKRRVPLTAGDGDYWFNMIIKSKAQLKQEDEQGKKSREPQSGDAPEMRVRLDTKAPIAKLFAPTPDVTRPNTLMLQWAAQDENLGEAPVTLEWAETKDGPWHGIGINLANTGRHSWAIPDTLPVQVHMRLRVRDLADNESIAVTQEPLIVDLKEARGRLKSVQPLPRIPGK